MRTVNSTYSPISISSKYCENDSPIIRLNQNIDIKNQQKNKILNDRSNQIFLPKNASKYVNQSYQNNLATIKHNSQIQQIKKKYYQQQNITQNINQNQYKNSKNYDKILSQQQNNRNRTYSNRQNIINTQFNKDQHKYKIQKQRINNYQKDRINNYQKDRTINYQKQRTINYQKQRTINYQKDRLSAYQKDRLSAYQKQKLGLNYDKDNKRITSNSYKLNQSQSYKMSQNNPYDQKQIKKYQGSSPLINQYKIQTNSLRQNNMSNKTNLSIKQFDIYSPQRNIMRQNFQYEDSSNKTNGFQGYRQYQNKKYNQIQNAKQNYYQKTSTTSPNQTYSRNNMKRDNLQTSPFMVSSNKNTSLSVNKMTQTNRNYKQDHIYHMQTNQCKKINNFDQQKNKIKQYQNRMKQREQSFKKRQQQLKLKYEKNKQSSLLNKNTNSPYLLATVNRNNINSTVGDNKKDLKNDQKINNYIKKQINNNKKDGDSNYVYKQHPQVLNKQRSTHKINSQIQRLDYKIKQFENRKKQMNINYKPFQKVLNYKTYNQTQTRLTRNKSNIKNINNQQQQENNIKQKQSTLNNERKIIEEMKKQRASNYIQNTKPLYSQKTLNYNNKINNKRQQSGFAFQLYRIQSQPQQSSKASQVSICSTDRISKLSSQYSQKNLTQCVNQMQIQKRADEGRQQRKKKLQGKLIPQNTQILKKLVSLLSEQCLLDQQFRNNKIWFNAIQSDNKWKQVKKVIRDHPQYNNIKLTQNNNGVYQQFKVSEDQNNPFFSINQPSKFSYQSLLKSFVFSNSHWKQKIQSRFDKLQLMGQNFNKQKLDLQKKGYINVQDLVRFLNIQSGNFYRNRDLFLIYQRLVKKNQQNQQHQQQLNFEQILNALTY